MAIERGEGEGGGTGFFGNLIVCGIRESWESSTRARLGSWI